MRILIAIVGLGLGVTGLLSALHAMTSTDDLTARTISSLQGTVGLLGALMSMGFIYLKEEKRS